ncbi:MAG: MmcQ/YjbR family DNA-binding protein [Taibaiella sp.]|nr:MmcQ/YjbR family DNA-binding protein [Taibaiella sp.]
MNLDQLRAICMACPGTSEGLKWEDHICFMVGGKMFCITSESGGANLKTTDEDFELLTERPGIIPAPYMARNKWVYIENFGALRQSEWEQYVRISYELIFSKLTKKLRTELQSNASR